MHKSGFEKPLHKFFVYTGNTTWGVQNLEYDEENGLMYITVWKFDASPWMNNLGMLSVQLLL